MFGVQTGQERLTIDLLSLKLVCPGFVILADLCLFTPYRHDLKHFVGLVRRLAHVREQEQSADIVKANPPLALRLMCTSGRGSALIQQPTKEQEDGGAHTRWIFGVDRRRDAHHYFCLLGCRYSPSLFSSFRRLTPIAYAP